VAAASCHWLSTASTFCFGLSFVCPNTHDTHSKRIFQSFICNVSHFLLCFYFLGSNCGYSLKIRSIAGIWQHFGLASMVASQNTPNKPTQLYGFSAAIRAAGRRCRENQCQQFNKEQALTLVLQRKNLLNQKTTNTSSLDNLI
ncbi:MAG: hypothetical protein MUF43_13390, partial [Flavobacterium sp.]|nr:hypothetical protein [Flavobacterium sp.]